MAKIHLVDTVAELDARIIVALQAVNSATEQYRFLQQARIVLASPLALGISFHIAEEEQPASLIPSAYGGLKRSVFSCLSEVDGGTPQTIVETMQAQGYTFRSKTPAISVNEALQTLKSEGKAILFGKSPTGANLWTKAKGVAEPSDDEGQEETPTEVGV